MLRCFCYWDKGYDKMPDMIKFIYNHNHAMSKKHNFELILVTDENVGKFINVPPIFNKLSPNHKSDVVRIYCLHKYGGVWIDADVIIIKDLNLQWANMMANGKHAILDIELNSKIGCATMAMLANSRTSLFCFNHINVLLESHDIQQNIKWDFLGPANVKLAYLTMPEHIILNNYETVRQGCNFITWADKPGFTKGKWLLETESLAKEFADKVNNNKNCYYVITWTIYNKNDITGNIVDFVFNNNKSVFYYLTTNETKLKLMSPHFSSITDIINNTPKPISTLINEYISLQKQIDNVEKPAEQPSTKNIKQKYLLSVAAVFKNEAHALDEWIQHYLKRDVEHIYLINDFSTDSHADIIKKYGDKITLFENNIITDQFGRQKMIYEKYLRPILKETEYLAILDLDEFLYSPSNMSFKDFFAKYNRHGQIIVNWLIFGSNNHIDQPKSIINGFTKRANAINNDVINPYDFKSIIKTSNVISFGVHNHECLGDTLYLGVDSEELIINHYIVQSLVFYMDIKCTRGCADNFMNCPNKHVVEQQRKNRKRFNFIDNLANEVFDERLKVQK